jgi:uroporphyrinogen III methyltransferase / synthase
VTGSLEGRTLLVTRPRQEAEELAVPLRSLGADVLVGPAIRLEPGDDAGVEEAAREATEGRFDWIVFTSTAGVRAWFDRTDGRPTSRVAAVGSGTAEALRSRGVDPDLVPETFTTEALGEAFPEGSGRVLLPRADLATDELDRALAGKGWATVRVEAYRIRHEERLPQAVEGALASGLVDAVTFTSASTVEGFARATSARPPAVCIGPVTSEAARVAGFEVVEVADPHTVEGVVEAVRRALGS